MSQLDARRGRVLVTGASGFIGRDLSCRLAGVGWHVRAAARDTSALPVVAGIEPAHLADLAAPTDWTVLLEGVTHVVHLAGIAHATSTIPAATYHAVNAEAVGSLARAAAIAGIRRVVLMSSIRAQCGASADGVVDEHRPASPDDDYGRAKLAGEKLLAEALAGSGTTWTTLRPVLVYGPGVKGNMAALARLARRRLPLPIGGLTARRSLLGLDNLAGAVEHALVGDRVSGSTFLLADPGALTVPQIVTAMREGLGRAPGIVSIPLSPLRFAAALAGRRAAWQRIAGDLVVSTAALEATGWRPRTSARDGITQWMRDAGQFAGA